jgi:CRISPR-associated endonuclease Csn1
MNNLNDSSNSKPQLRKMRYRLALDLGTTSIGWALLRLDSSGEPNAVIRAGSRIFSDGRHPKTGTSLAVERREKRSMRRRRDRLLRRKKKIASALVEFGFFPADMSERKKLEVVDPYDLRVKALDAPLSGAEFARALFHINQRRGFKSNRKTDSKENDTGALKSAILTVRKQMEAVDFRTVAEFLHWRREQGLPIRARYRENKVPLASGKSKIEKSYDLYIDRAMVEDEFDKIWAVQAKFNPTLFHEEARTKLKDILLYQRKLKPVVPGKCTLLPEQQRAPLALPLSQRFRILQEINNLEYLVELGKYQKLSDSQKQLIFAELDRVEKRTFTQIRKILDLPESAEFNLEDGKRDSLNGNLTSARLGSKKLLGSTWFSLDDELQHQVVEKILNEESQEALCKFLEQSLSVSEDLAEEISKVKLPDGHSSLCVEALSRINPVLKTLVITYDKAVKEAGFDHHSLLDTSSNGEILEALPYYGIPLARHVAFGSGNPADSEEKRFGKIANPTVHIGLNQVRIVVNAIIKRYGHPSEVIIEVARDLKNSREKRIEIQKQQKANQDRNSKLRIMAAELLACEPSNVSRRDIEKLILWHELSKDPLDRRCPYSGAQISAAMVLTPAIEIEHILPFSQTLDDSLNNKTLATRQSNRDKGNQNPFEAFGKFARSGYDYQSILLRAAMMPKAKAYRFYPDGYQLFLKESNGFLARALNDTSYLSRIAVAYLKLICPNATRSIPGRMTALLRQKFRLDEILALKGEKNRNDHRHHAIDACVIGVTDQSMLQKFAKASASAREKQLQRLVEDMPLPFDNYFEHVKRAVKNIVASHKPDHGHQGAMHNDTAYGLRADGFAKTTKRTDGKKEVFVEKLAVIAFAEPNQNKRHGLTGDGLPKPYKGYKGDSNFCIEITTSPRGVWEGRVVSTFEAYQAQRTASAEGKQTALQHPAMSIEGKPLAMRLIKGDALLIEVKGVKTIVQIASISGNGQIFMFPPNEANVDSRNRDAEDSFKYISKTPGSLQKTNAVLLKISPIGDVNRVKLK